MPPPPPPTNLRLDPDPAFAARRHDALKIAWDIAAPADGFEVEVVTAGTTRIVAASSGEWIAGMPPRSVSSLRVRARVGAQVTAWSTPLVGECRPAPPPPPAVTDPDPASPLILVAWSIAAGVEERVRIRALAGGVAIEDPGDFATSDSRLLAWGSSDTEYSIRILAPFSNGQRWNESAWSPGVRAVKILQPWIGMGRGVERRFVAVPRPGFVQRPGVPYA